MTDATETEKTLAQIAYETFLDELAKTEHRGEVEGAPDWDHVPEHVRAVLAISVAEAVRSFAPALVPDASHEDQSFGQVGYQAYVACTGGLNYQGLPCPEWSQLTDAIRAAWVAAATGIRSEHEHRFAAEFDLEVSKDELAELIAGLDALQRADKHTADLTFPLRSRLRGMLFPPEAAAEEPEEAPSLEASEVEPKALPAADPPSAQDEKGEVIADDALDPVPVATESPAPERTDPTPAPESPSAVNAPEGNVAPAVDPTPSPGLPAVSEAPPAPGLPGLDPVAVAAPVADSGDMAPTEAPPAPSDASAPTPDGKVTT